MRCAGGELEGDPDGLAAWPAAETGMAASCALDEAVHVTRTVGGEVAVPLARRGVRLRTSAAALIVTMPELPTMRGTAVAGSASRMLPAVGTGTAVDVCESHWAVAERPCSVAIVLSAPDPVTVLAPICRKPATAACGSVAAMCATVSSGFLSTGAGAGDVAATTTLTASLATGKPDGNRQL